MIIYAVGILTLAGFYGIIAMILNIEAGWGGLWDLGIAGLLAVGAYLYVLTTLNDPDAGVTVALGWPLWVGVLGSGVISALVALAIGTPALRLRGEYFLITTFAFAEVIRQLIINQSSLTKGTVGFTQLARPFSEAVSPRTYNYVLLGIMAVALLLVFLLCRRLARSPYGRLMRAMRDNEPLALSLGKHVARYRIQTFVLVGFLFGLVAPLYIWYLRSITPGVFASDITFTAWTALVVGGLASIGGPAIGAAVLIAVTEGLQFIPVSAEHATLLAATRPFLLGLALIVVLRLRPEGLVPERWAFRRMSHHHRDMEPVEVPAPLSRPAGYRPGA